jgi:hypothetical protein
MLHVLKKIIIIFEKYAWINIQIESALMEDVHDVLPLPVYYSNAITCNSLTVFITFLVLSVIDSFFGRVIVTGIKDINFD